uniref:Acyl-CoA dehydrogenase/oxidase C-terminal domain-containing protein n=1 Tax=Amblyomma triste TaxID=251400 RepID=A0A023GIA3_AMBTT
MKTPGVTVARSIKKLGNRSSDTAQIFFEDVRVPAKNIVGEEGMGFVYQMLQFQVERLVAAINCVPFLERVIEETLEYCKQRKVFGQPLSQNQVIQFRLAELQTEVEALRALGYRAAALLMAGDNVTELASMAKLKAGRLAREVADSCLQYWGGMGYTEEMPMAKVFRDARLLSIAGGADEIMLAIIAKLRWGLER